MEHWIIYDLATGEPRWRGSGSAGTAALQPLGDTFGIVLVPQLAIEGADIDLDVIRAAMEIWVDNEAEAIRQRFITALPGQVGAYILKANVARRWLADSTSSIVMLEPEMASRNMTVEALCAEVLQREADWERAAGAIEGLRLGAKDGIGKAATLGAIVAAARVDWSTLYA